MKMITVLGASGFIGSHLLARLRKLKLQCQGVGRNNPLPDGNLGNAVYCIGVTADFRSRLFDTVDAHVCKLLEGVRNCEFERSEERRVGKEWRSGWSADH